MTTAPPTLPKRGRAPAPPGGGCLRPGPSGPASAPPGGGCLRLALAGMAPACLAHAGQPRRFGRSAGRLPSAMLPANKNRYAGQIPAPPAAASALGPWLRCSLRLWPRPAAASGLRRAFAVRVPLRLSGSACRAGARPSSAAVPAPRRLAAPPAAASGGSVPGPSPGSLCSPLGCSGWACGPPFAPLRALSGPLGGAMRRGPLARPRLRRAALRLGSVLRPGASGGPAGRFLRPPAPGLGVLGCSAPAGAGLAPPAGGGRRDPVRCWGSWAAACDMALAAWSAWAAVAVALCPREWGDISRQYQDVGG